MGRHRMIREGGGEFWRKSEAEKEREEEQEDWELGAPTRPFLELKDVKWAKWNGHQSPRQVPYPVLVEGSKHALYILGGLLIACDLEEALKLVHEERAAGALHHELLVPLLELRHVHLAGRLRLLPAELLPHPGPRIGREQGPVSSRLLLVDS